MTHGRPATRKVATWFRSSVRRARILPEGFDARLAVQSALLVLAILYTLYFAAALVAPLAAAVLLYQLLHRPVRALHRTGLPLAACSAIVLFGLVCVLGIGAKFLSGPAEQWLRDAPASLGELRRELSGTSGTLDELRELGEEIDELAKMGENDADVPTVQIRAPGHLEAITGSLPTIISEALLALVTCFFLLVQGDRLGRSLVELGGTPVARRRISNFLRGVNQQVTTYLTTVTAINIALGVVVTIVLLVLGVPHPEMWGVLAGILNFAPYIGPAVNTFILAVVGVMTFDTLGEAMLVPAAYIVVTSLEGMVITPMILGHRGILSSLWVFLAVVFWGWMWGPVGALMAVPMTASILVLWKAWRDSDPFYRVKPVVLAAAVP